MLWFRAHSTNRYLSARLVGCGAHGRPIHKQRPRNTLRFAYLKGDNYCGSRGTVRVPMLVRCVHCDAELVAPVRSEYRSDKYACHIWHCPSCCACFSSVVSFRADANTKPLKDILTEGTAL